MASVFLAITDTPLITELALKMKLLLPQMLDADCGTRLRIPVLNAPKDSISMEICAWLSLISAKPSTQTDSVLLVMMDMI
jgi:hypothetical protein